MKVFRRYMTGRKRFPVIVRQTTGHLSMLWLDWVFIDDQDQERRELWRIVMLAFWCFVALC